MLYTIYAKPLEIFLSLMLLDKECRLLNVEVDGNKRIYQPFNDVQRGEEETHFTVFARHSIELSDVSVHVQFKP